MVGANGNGQLTASPGALIVTNESWRGRSPLGNGAAPLGHGSLALDDGSVDGAIWRDTGDFGVARELAALDSLDVLAVSGTAARGGRVHSALSGGFDSLLANRRINGAFAEFISARWQGKRFVLDTSDTQRLRRAGVDVPVAGQCLPGCRPCWVWRTAAARTWTAAPRPG